MIALLLAVAAAPFADAFWDRDLGALARELLEHRRAAQAALFEDLVRLCDCETLAPLETPDPLRQLVRTTTILKATGFLLRSLIG